MKLLEEMPKITKCLKLRYSVDFKLETQDRQLLNFHDFWFPYAQHRSLIKKTERSDTTILGIFRFIRDRGLPENRLFNINILFFTKGGV